MPQGLAIGEIYLSQNVHSELLTVHNHDFYSRVMSRQYLSTSDYVMVSFSYF